MLNLAALLALATLVQTPGDAARTRATERLLDGKPSEAVTILDAAALREPDSAEIHLDLADAHVAVASAMPEDGRDAAAYRRHLELAETHFKRARTLAPALAPLVTLRLISLYDDGQLARPKDAEPLVRALRTNEPANPLYDVLLARTLMKLRRTTEAVTVLVDAAAQVAPDGQMFLAMTSADLVLQHPTIGRGDQRRLLEAVVTLSDEVIARNDPEMRDALQVKSGALLLLAERTARNESERADLKARGDATFGQFYALAPRRTPEQERAAASAAAREQREGDMRKVSDEVAAQLKAGRRADAEKAIAAATEAYGNEPLFWQNIAWKWHEVGEPEAAVVALMRAADLDPKNPERHHVVGTFHWEAVFRGKTLSAVKKQEHIAAGLAAEDRTLALNPEYFEALVYRGLLLQQRAELETNAARKKALLDEAAALKARAQAIQAARQKSGG